MIRLQTSIFFLVLTFFSVSCWSDKGSSRDKVLELYQGYQQEMKDVPDMSSQEAQILLEQGKAILVDVRRPDERQVSMIPGAISVEDFEKMSLELKKSKMIISYCTIGLRSGLYTRSLIEKGYQAKNLRGSILLWVNEGLPVIDPFSKKTVQQVHVYGADWNHLPDNYQATW